MGDDRRNKNSEELLAQLLTNREHLEMLQYSKNKGLESDDAVHFLVGLLKLFALAYDRMLEVFQKVDVLREELNITAHSSELRLSAKLYEERQLIEAIVSKHTRLMGSYSMSFATTTGEIKVLREILDKSVQDARDVLKLYDSLKDGKEDTSLARMFRDQVDKALIERVPRYDMAFRDVILDAIAFGMKRYFVIVQIEFLLLVIGAWFILHWMHR